MSFNPYLFTYTIGRILSLIHARSLVEVRPSAELGQVLIVGVGGWIQIPSCYREDIV